MRLADSSKAQAWSNRMRFAEVPKYKQTALWAWGRETWLGELNRASKKFHRETWAWLTYKDLALPDLPKLAESIALLQNRVFQTTNSTVEEEAPIFVLSTGWRAGSTLLQRILVTDPHLVLWGEPLGEMALVSRLAEMVSNSINPLKLGVWENQAGVTLSALATSWIANLYPSTGHFREALRGLFDQWLGKPARDCGFTRWGFKEVRYGATEASLLHWLYPNAKFVVISRHPYDSYRSLADVDWTAYYRYPNVPVDSAAVFARNWNRLATGWSKVPAGFPCFYIKYEDLIGGKVDFRKLESWLDIEIKENVALSASVGVSTKRKSLTWYQRLIIAREAEDGMRALGYAT
jgi:hypothetical protein